MLSSFAKIFSHRVLPGLHSVMRVPVDHKVSVVSYLTYPNTEHHGCVPG
jgi:hypothetical protein